MYIIGPKNSTGVKLKCHWVKEKQKISPLFEAVKGDTEKKMENGK